MKNYTTIKYETLGAVATVTLNRPDSLNSFNKTMRAELAQALKQAADNHAIRIVLFTGAGRAFSAGADLKAGMPPEGQTVEQQLQDEYRPSLELITGMDKPVMAVINGPVAGIALGYVMACDLAIMSENAYLLSPFTTISLLGDGGINWHLPRYLGYKKAYEYSIECKKMSAKMALEMGMVNKIVLPEVLEETAMVWAQALTKRAPLTMAATKKAMRFAMQNTFEHSFDLEAKMQNGLLGSADNIEGVTAFLEKRKPVFTGNK